MMIKFGESGHPGFRATSPLSRGTLKSKGGGKLSIHFCADGDTIETVFRTIISVNQLSNNGAVSDVCEENSTCQTSTGRPVLAEQSDIQEFDSKWDGILLSMTKIPHDDILEGLYTLRIESEKLKTVLELYDLETHQKKLEPDYHRLKTMVKRSIEQEIRNKNFGSRNGTFEKNAVVKNQGTKQRVQRILGDCW